MVHKLAELVDGAKSADPFQRCTILVPSLRLAESARRGLARLVAQRSSRGQLHRSGLCVNLNFETPVGLARTILASSERSFDPYRRLSSAKLFVACLKQGKRCNDASFIELLDSVAFPILERAYHQWRELPSKARLIQRVYAGSLDVTSRCDEVERDLMERSIWDETDLLAAAAETVDARDDRLSDLGQVILYLPQLPNFALVELYRSLAQGRNLAVIAPLTGEVLHDTAMQDWLNALGVNGMNSETSVPDCESAPSLLVPQSPGLVMSVSDPDEEVRTALRELSLAAERSLQGERGQDLGFSAAILYGRSDPYQRIVHEQLLRAQYRFNGDALAVDADRFDSISFGERAGLMLSALLTLFTTEMPRRALVAWVERFRPHVAQRPLRAQHCELVTRILGSQGTLDGLTRAAMHYLSLSFDVQRSVLRDHLPEVSFATSQSVAESVDGFLALLEVLAEAQRVALEITTPEALTSWCGWLIETLCQPQRDPQAHNDEDLWRVSEHGEDVRQLDGEMWRWLEEVVFAVDHCGVLTLAELREVFVIATRLTPRSLGRFGTGVFVGTLTQARYLDFDFVAVLGMNEGLLPQTPHSPRSGVDFGARDEDQRSQLSAPEPSGDEEALYTPKEEVYREIERHRIQMSIERGWADLLAVTSLAQSWRLLWSRGSLRSSSLLVPSRYLKRLAAVVHGGGGVLESVTLPSAYFSLRASTFPSSLAELRLGRLLNDPAAIRGDGAFASDRLLLHDQVYQRGRELQRSRRSPLLTVFDGWVDAALVGEFGSELQPTSASTLESWFSCPFGFFLRYILKVQPIRSPEGHLLLDPARHGTLLHREMERVLASLDLSDPCTLAPTSMQNLLEQATVRLEDDLIELGRLNLGGLALLAPSEALRIRSELRRLLRLLSTSVGELRIDQLLSELGFGDRSPWVIDLQDGKRLALRGRVDLIGLSQGVPKLVVDYKSGSDGRYLEVSDGSPTGDGGRFQLALYVLAVASHDLSEVRASVDTPKPSEKEAPNLVAQYWFASRNRRKSTRGFTATQPVLEQSIVEISRVLSLIRDGFFVGRPHGTLGCVFCKPYGLQLGPQASTLQAKLADPRFNDAIALVFRSSETDSLSGPNEATSEVGR